jgi:hypothetical protein
MLKSVAPAAIAVCGVAFGIGVFVTDRSSNITDAAAAATSNNDRRVAVSTIDPNDNLYRQCLTEVVNRQNAASRADEQRFLEQTRGLPRAALYNMMAMTRQPSPDEIALAQRENFRRVKEYCRLNFPCSDGAEVSVDYNTCIRRVE